MTPDEARKKARMLVAAYLPKKFSGYVVKEDHPVGDPGAWVFHLEDDRGSHHTFAFTEVYLRDTPPTAIPATLERLRDETLGCTHTNVVVRRDDRFIFNSWAFD